MRAIVSRPCHRRHLGWRVPSVRL